MIKQNLLHKFSMVLLTVTTLLISACDDDVMQARMLSGKWQGDWGMFYEYEYRGHIYTFTCNDTHIEFFPDHATGTTGIGRQIDYYDAGPYEYQYYYFHWSIRDGIVSLYYPYDPALNTSISEYSMNNHVFTGFFINGYDRFYLRKWADYFDWSGFNAHYCYSIRPYEFPYFAPKQSETDSIILSPVHTDTTEGRVLRRGNRFAAK